MTDEVLKKKIVEVVLNSEITGIQIRAITGGYSMANNIADALIAANIGDVAAHKAEAEHWEKICKFESVEYHTTIKNAAKHAHHLMQERDEYKHRTEVAEKQVYCLARSFAEALCKNGNAENLIQGFIQDAQKQAEKELAEEKKK